ncbi:hypothetical protein SETIT_9G279600v2 [Setaria italica]|uniref:Uncharacterized protein n=1 Tax=Setaria italica TaxID=4555 RepID=A0A368SN71_SETIT|nr:hypothetical protein SETIT_9G279600v2 [Setaria italica]
MRPCVAAHLGPAQRRRQAELAVLPSRHTPPGCADSAKPSRSSPSARPSAPSYPWPKRRRRPRHGPATGHLHCPPGRAFRSAAPPPLSRFTTIVRQEVQSSERRGMTSAAERSALDRFSVIAALVTCAIRTVMFTGATVVTSHSLFTDKFTQVCTN